MKSSEPLWSSLKEKTPSGAVPCDTAVKKNGFCAAETVAMMSRQRGGGCAGMTHVAEVGDGGEGESEEPVGGVGHEL